jgi:hypothetical protein
MKITKIRKFNKKLDWIELSNLNKALQDAIDNAGYISQVRNVNSSRIDVSNNGCSFVIDINKHGYNTRAHNGHKTRFPTWTQRVEFNNIIQKVLDDNDISCNVTSLHYKIREGLYNYDETDWLAMRKNWEHHNESLGYCII